MDHKNEYHKYAHLVMDRTGSTIIEVIQIKDNNQRLKKIAEIKPKGYYLFYTTITKTKNKLDDVLSIRPPYIVDFDSVPEPEPYQHSVNDDKLKCKECGKTFSSSSGLTNHHNAKHSGLGQS